SALDLRPEELSWPQVLSELEAEVSPDGKRPNARIYRLIQNAEALGKRAAAHKCDLDRRRRAKTKTGFDAAHHPLSGSLSEDEAEFDTSACLDTLENNLPPQESSPDNLAFKPLVDDGFMAASVADASRGYSALSPPSFLSNPN